MKSIPAKWAAALSGWRIPDSYKLFRPDWTYVCTCGQPWHQTIGLSIIELAAISLKPSSASTLTSTAPLCVAQIQSVFCVTHFSRKEQLDICSYFLPPTSFIYSRSEVLVFISLLSPLRPSSYLTLRVQSKGVQLINSLIRNIQFLINSK
jgi:hypothetical protein